MYLLQKILHGKSDDRAEKALWRQDRVVISIIHLKKKITNQYK